MKKVTRLDFYPDFFQGVAHRGLYDESKTENGLNAFKNAIDKGFAFEFDVHLTKDNKLIVMHDSNLKRTTGKEGIIEDLDLKTIKDNYKLLDGEEVPTLEEVIKLNQEKSTMVIELKPYKNNSKELAKYTKECINNNVKDTKRVTLISFDPNVLIHYGKTKIKKGFLISSSRKDAFLFMDLFDYLDVEDSLVDDKRIMKYRSNSHILNVWTINNIETYKQLIKKADTITFEHIDPYKVKELYIS